MLESTGNNELSSQASENKKNYKVLDNIGDSISSGDASRSIKNLSSIVKLRKSKKLILAMFKKFNLNFAKINFF